MHGLLKRSQNREASLFVKQTHRLQVSHCICNDLHSSFISLDKSRELR
jgi:hypothetical protein